MGDISIFYVVSKKTTRPLENLIVFNFAKNIIFWVRLKLYVRYTVFTRVIHAIA